MAEKESRGLGYPVKEVVADFREPIFKRPFDLFLSAFGLLLSLPLWILIAAGIWLEDGGPIFFRQDRIGRYGRLFKALKFRSMFNSPARVEVQASRNDPRITRVGRLLRRTALDELPQIWNIFVGDMSFVGPRSQPEKEIVRVGGERKELHIRQVPGFVRLIAAGDPAGAIAKLKETTSFPAVCGRVCPQEEQCEELCILGVKQEPVAIGRLERYAADWEFANGSASTPETAPKNGKRVGVVGSGPAGLTCAGELAKLGYDVTIYEALHKPGGVLVYGIPEFRLPKAIVQRECDYVESLGVEIKLDYVIGRTLTVDQMLADGPDRHEAIFLANGAGLPSFMGIPGENLNGVYSANEFLTRSNLMKAYRFPEYDTPINVGKTIAVVGGGNVAMDAARTALRLGADVRLIYRRSHDEMPARGEEIEHAEEEGIVFDLLTNPTQIIGNENGWVQ